MAGQITLLRLQRALNITASPRVSLRFTLGYALLRLQRDNYPLPSDLCPQTFALRPSSFDLRPLTFVLRPLPSDLKYLLCGGCNWHKMIITRGIMLIIDRFPLVFKFFLLTLHNQQ